jgi:2',3'-cyclic-nucleotide 2'-phosphodiesterase (5'-nucleotidase family)
MKRLVLYSVLLILVLFAGSCHTSYFVSEANLKNNPVNSGLVSEDSAMIRTYLPYKTNLEKDMSRVIGFTTVEMEKGKPESLLTNFLGDLLLDEGNQYLKQSGKPFSASLSYFNYGGIRTYLPKGDITVGKVFELMPFENELVFIRLKGADVKSFLDVIAGHGGDSLGGVRFTIEGGKATNIFIGGKTFDTNSEYWMATNDYVAEGGDDMSMLRNRTEIIPSGKLIRDLIIANLEKIQANGKTVSSKLDGRIK